MAKPKPSPRADFSALRKAVQEIYAELAQRPISRNCSGISECCRFKLTGRTPFITKGEALVAWQGIRASGRKQLPESIAGACPLLKVDGKCMIYQHRPFGCRTHFCKAAGGPYAREEVRDLIQRLEEIDRALGGEGGVNLPGALAAASNDS
jgi:Fe-S-cluster containining protein